VDEIERKATVARRTGPLNVHVHANGDVGIAGETFEAAEWAALLAFVGQYDLDVLASAKEVEDGRKQK